MKSTLNRRGKKNQNTAGLSNERLELLFFHMLMKTLKKEEEEEELSQSGWKHGPVFSWELLI